jgi:hypothetical protein
MRRIYETIKGQDLSFQRNCRLMFPRFMCQPDILGFLYSLGQVQRILWSTYCMWPAVAQGSRQHTFHPRASWTDAKWVYSSLGWEWTGELLLLNAMRMQSTKRVNNEDSIKMDPGPCGRRLPTAAARVRSQDRSSGICGGQCGTGVGFLRVLRFPLPILIPPTALHSSSSIIRGWYNEPNSGRCTKWTASLHPKKLEKIRIRK